jgi:hypothetical protein
MRLMKLVADRHGWPYALSMGGYLSARKAGLSGADITGQATRARYRKILAELNAEGLSPDWATGTQQQLSRAS